MAAASAADTAACARLADLCSTSDQKVDAAGCLKELADARKMAGPGGVGMGAMGEFLKGLGGALSK